MSQPPSPNQVSPNQVSPNPVSPNPVSPKPSSPCTKLCILDAATGMCEGCGRTRDEIALWGSLSEPRRLAIMATLPGRLAAASPSRGKAAAAR